MNLFEYQGKELLARSGVATPDGRLAATPDEAADIAEELGPKVVVKAQVRTGGRGKAGGIIVAESPRAAREAASSILSLVIGGQPVSKVLVEAAVAIHKEHYASVVLDRSSRSHLFMVSPRGGMDIEAVAGQEPAAVLRLLIDPLVGLNQFQVNRMVKFLGIEGRAGRQAGVLLQRMYRLYVDYDATLVEVNPLVTTPSNEVLALDAKVAVDDSASFRHPEFDLFEEESDDIQAEARRQGLATFVKLDGDVGIIGNGAGLVMATLDLVDQVGGRAANFLDVGGGADSKTLSSALELILSDGRARSVLINIFGGITRCDLVAEGIVDALSRMKVNVPVVVRLAGTNVEEGRRILIETNDPRVVASKTMLEAAQEAVEAAR
ncbi:MAG TPA: ADP-forming succinate--CoA ligase subunit beta [Actinomycetota bacterium]|nr:ADP-forming succinate--CoA ligase subunit beta [Actinomycetota bacterium]